MYGGSGTIRNCIISNNLCSGNGGGIYLAASAVLIVDCEIDGNYCLGSGGGIASLLCSPIIERCRIERNHAETDDGALRLELGSPEIRDCTISDNRTDAGFAITIHCDNPDQGKLLRTIITGNTGSTPSRIGCLSLNSALIDHCTIAGNDGYLAVGHLAGKISNTIIAFNEGEAIRCGASLQVECSDIFGNSLANDICGQDLGGNFSLDPIFCDDLSISTTSPCAPSHAPAGCGLVGAHDPTCTSAVEHVTWGRVKAGAWR